ncbi:maltase 1-like [Odontomachus brunneus]|uniref:maltase 1-like n=1 Tax=Odontomachus brunneus TaxID=486640 RepID=UPI0013F2834C|nr:maltase 1-like [Odontomachus brunneus]
MLVRVVVLSLLLTIALTSGEILNQGWWSHTVFYQVYPRSFMDANDDGVGDLKGVTSKLEHFVESGVGAIWLSPINRSPMVDFGYDISDFKDIDGIFGTIEDFKDLVARAKKLGLKVILDLVPNHTSDEHYWFNQSVHRVGKYADYYVWADGRNNNKDPPNNWLSVFSGPAWTFNETRKQWYFHQFERRQPDLNYSNPNVQEEMQEVIEYWLRKGVDGFRVDAVPHLFETNYTSDEPESKAPDVTKDDYGYLNHTLTKDQPQTYELVRSWRKILDDYANRTNTDEKVMMTEAYTSLENTIKYYNYGSHIPFNFNFIMNVNANSNAAEFKNIIDEWMKAKPKDGVANWVMGNHDRNRTATRYPGRPDQMTMLAMTLPGVAVTYYGEEIGMVDKSDISWEDTQDPQACNAGKEKYRSRSRDPVRTPFQWNSGLHAGFSNTKNKTWLPIHENYRTVNLHAQKSANESHYKVYRALTKLRETSDALKSGSVTTQVLNSTVLLVLRKTQKEAATLLINFSIQNKWEGDLTGVLTGFEGGVVKVASVDSKIRENQIVDLKKVNLPARASMLFLSDGK